MGQWVSVLSKIWDKAAPFSVTGTENAIYPLREKHLGLFTFYGKKDTINK